MTQSLVVISSPAEGENPVDYAAEIARAESELNARRRELGDMQAAFRAFKIRYAQTVGARLAELGEIERAVKKAEEEWLGLGGEDQENELGEDCDEAPPVRSGHTTLRKLFWSVAKLFHPDHALDEGEARRRHTIMVEASRAYGEGDVESLHLLLGDESLRSHCRAGSDPTPDDRTDLRRHLLELEEELRTVEFGLRRLKEDVLYQLKLKADAEAALGRDTLQESARDIERQIVKARRRLEHLSTHA